jgi:transposase-like protein
VEAYLNLPKERYAMSSNSSIVPLRQPDTIDDPLTTILRSGARRLLAQAIEAEADAFLAEMKGFRLPDGRERVVRHGHGPERLIQTGIGPVAVEAVKLRDRGAGEAAAERIRFSSAILPRWARRTRSLDALLPILYLRGVSMGDFQEALAALLGQRSSEPVASGHRTATRPSTGTTCAPPTRSRACSPRSATARSAPRARCRKPPPD